MSKDEIISSSEPCIQANLVEEDAHFGRAWLQSSHLPKHVQDQYYVQAHAFAEKVNSVRAETPMMKREEDRKRGMMHE